MFTQTTEYALRAMACLSQHESQLISANQLAGWTKVPGNYLAKVLQELAAAGLVVGRRGVGGGYRLARDSKDITLLDILRGAGWVARHEAPAFDIGSDNWTLGPLYRGMDSAVEAAVGHLQGVSLRDLAQDSDSKAFEASPPSLGRGSFVTPAASKPIAGRAIANGMGGGMGGGMNGAATAIGA